MDNEGLGNEEPEKENEDINIDDGGDGGNDNNVDANDGNSDDDKGKGATAFDTDDEHDDDSVNPKNWPDDWREKYAGDDEKKLARLRRYASPTAALDALFAAQERISSDGLPKEFPEGGTEEEIAQWREENGIPKEWSEYDTEFEDGFKWGEADQPYVEAYLKKMHENNAPPSMVRAGLESYKEMIEEESAARQAMDIAHRRDFEDEMRAEWGSSYRANVNMVKNYLSGLPEEVSEGLQSGRSADGKAFLNNPVFVNWLVNDVINKVNPEINILASTGVSSISSIDDELKEIAEKRRTNRKAYFADKDLLARERELLAAKEKIKSK